MRYVVALCLSLVALAGTTARADPALEKPVGGLIRAVQYGKDTVALEKLDGPSQGAILLGDAWQKATPAQRDQFVTLFHQLFAALAFPKIRENFKNLATMTYEPSKADGDKADVTSTVVINHPLKKQEMKAKYSLNKRADGWRIVDVTVLGTGGASMLSDIRKDQVKPLLEKHGLDGLLKLMQDRLASLKK